MRFKNLLLLSLLQPVVFILYARAQSSKLLYVYKCSIKFAIIKSPKGQNRVYENNAIVIGVCIMYTVIYSNKDGYTYVIW